MLTKPGVNVVFIFHSSASTKLNRSQGLRRDTTVLQQNQAPFGRPSSNSRPCASNGQLSITWCSEAAASASGQSTG